MVSTGYLNVLGWIMVAIWAGGGIWSLSRPLKYWIAPGFSNVSVPDRARLDRALEVRERLEGAPAWLGRAFGIVFLVGACVAAIDRTSIILVNAVVTAASAALLAAAFFRLRNVGGPRVASLKTRSEVVSWFAFATVTVAALCPLLLFSASPVSAAVTAAASVSIVVLAWMVADLPALVRGDDVVVERFVDDRVRRVRVAAMLQVAITPAYFFVILTTVDTLVSLPGLAAFVFIVIVNLVLPFWTGAYGPRSPNADEVREWASDAR